MAGNMYLVGSQTETNETIDCPRLVGRLDDVPTEGLVAWYSFDAHRKFWT